MGQKIDKSLSHLRKTCPFRDSSRFYSNSLGKFELEPDYEELFERGISKARANEVLEYAKKMNYKKLGVAVCYALLSECRLFINSLRENAIKCVVVVCGPEASKTPSLNLDEIDSYVVVCDPLSQAEILNSKKTDFNIIVGLCLGNDSLLVKNLNALSSILV